MSVVSKSGGHTAVPWQGDQRGEDKTRVLKYLLQEPDGVPLTLLVERLFGVSAREDEGKYQTEYKFVKRFVENSDFLKIDRGLDVLHAYPRPSAFHLTSGKNFSNTDAVYRFPKDWAASFLETVDEVSGSRETILERQFFEYLEQIWDRWLIMKKRQPDPGEKPYLLRPYETLFNGESVARDNWRRYHGAWEQASEQYDVGVEVTLTTDPKKFDSVGEMSDSISTNFNRFMSWLVRGPLAERCSDVGQDGHSIRRCWKCRDGERPDYIKVLEWTEKGRPHLHVMLFGMNYLVHQSQLSGYWDQYQGRIVDIRGVRNRGGEWLSKDPDTGTQKNEKAHLGKYLSKQMGLEESLEEVESMVGGGEGLWKTAMYWATGKHFWTCSTGLKLADEGEELIDIAEYMFIGAAKSSDIPGHVIENAYLQLSKPPPQSEPSGSE